ncbi:hypothetical protein BJD12_11805 [Xanthomonas vesicatoria ATCC 35937]|nr:hypothetical protein BJD12_11805 [Xanthomonas vesicatoria ATCC 35937]KTF31327.1 hypothetical protein LMG920_16545 [Xanthomonas vesicatoria]
MADPLRVVTAIESFERWSAPWTFFDTVHATPQLTAEDRLLLQQVWSVACDAERWTSSPALDAGAAATESALTTRFAWLPPQACRQLARAASYAWR